MKFEKIAELIKEQEKNGLAKRLAAIKAGAPEWVTLDNLTPYRKQQLKAGEITPEQAAEIATKAATRKAEKHTAKELSRLAAAEQAPELMSVEISVEWKRSRTWGANPTATVYAETAAGYVTTTGSASGCGYDKESAAIAAALDKIPAVIRALCEKKEAALKSGAAAGNEYSSSNADLIAYGAGYGAIPYFEGGVGTNAHRNVFEACGLACQLERHHKNSDFYIFKKDAARA